MARKASPQSPKTLESPKTLKRRPKAAGKQPICLALQGGGSHGAFTWGVLDALLECERFEVKAVSGASAGAVNAAAMAEGFHRGGPGGARDCLAKVWNGVAEAGGVLAGLQRHPYHRINGDWSVAGSPFFWWLDFVTRMASPYDLNPLDYNPLRDLIAESVDFEQVRACQCPELFIAATNVESGRTKVFRTHELTLDHVMASAALPHLYKAVTIEGQHYWDGGYMGNPPLFPLFRKDLPGDIVVIQINPIHREGVPERAHEIRDRLNEITFNSSLLREYRAIEFVQRLLDAHAVSEADYKRLRLHRIDGGAYLGDLESGSRLNAEAAFIHELFSRGREAGREWLETDAALVGERSSLDIAAVLDNPDLGI